MIYWLISPRDPLIFRDGKPFTATPGSRSETLPIPFPSTLAGAVRTMAGRDPNTGQFQKSKITSLLKEPVHGPLLVELGDDNQVLDYLLPAPADAIMFRKKDKLEKAEICDLKPLDLNDIETDLADYNICGPAISKEEKPFPKPPTFWFQEKYMDWLKKTKEEEILVSEWGIQGLIKESRSHVSIDADTQIAEEGALFQTSGLEFNHLTRKKHENYQLSKVKRFGLLVSTEAEIMGGMDHLGGERRITHWQKLGSPLPFQNCPDDIKKSILEDGYCRLILITPAYFKKGNLPTWLAEQFDVTIEAVINKRYQGVSGWDYENNQPKPTSRLTPAGSVYFLKLPKEKEKKESFIKGVWLKTISDNDQKRLDGFGLAMLGVWDGKPRVMKMEKKNE